MSRFSISRSATLALSAALIAFPVSVTLTGCGSGSGDRSIAPVASGGSTVTNAYTGRYVSTIALDAGKNGALDMTVAANGAVTGTLTVTQSAAARGRQVYSFDIGAYNMSGSVNTTTGVFTVTGGIAPDTFSVVGTLPVPGNGNVGGTYTVNAGNETYSGSFATSVPNTGPSTPAPNPVPTNPPATPGNGAVTFTLVSKSADCNFDASTFGDLKVDTASYGAGQGLTFYTFTTNLKSKNAANSRTQFTLNWSRYNGPSSIMPETFTFTPTAAIGVFGDDFQGILSVLAAPVGQLGVGFWYPAGGTLVVESVSGSTVTVRGENVVFAPSNLNAASAKGTFTANFTATIENVPNL